MIRRSLFYIAGGVLALLCVALAAGWVRSWGHQDSFYCISVDARGSYAQPMFVSDNGRLAFIHRSRAGPTVGVVRVIQGWQHMARPHFFEFEEVRWMQVRHTAPTPGSLARTQVVVRYWLLLTVGLLLAMAWIRMAPRFRKQHATGSCPACGYDLQGNTSGVCPECGIAVAVRRMVE